MIDEMKLEICSMEKRLEQEERLLLGAERGREDARRKVTPVSFAMCCRTPSCYGPGALNRSTMHRRLLKKAHEGVSEAEQALRSGQERRAIEREERAFARKDLLFKDLQVSISQRLRACGVPPHEFPLSMPTTVVFPRVRTEGDQSAPPLRAPGSEASRWSAVRRATRQKKATFGQAQVRGP